MLLNQTPKIPSSPKISTPNDQTTSINYKIYLWKLFTFLSECQSDVEHINCVCVNVNVKNWELTMNIWGDCFAFQSKSLSSPTADDVSKLCWMFNLEFWLFHELWFNESSGKSFFRQMMQRAAVWTHERERRRMHQAHKLCKVIVHHHIAVARVKNSFSIFSIAPFSLYQMTPSTNSRLV